MCTINKSAHTKKAGNLSYAPRTYMYMFMLYIYIYIYIYILRFMVLTSSFGELMEKSNQSSIIK